MSRPDITHLTTEQQLAILHVEFEAAQLSLLAHGQTGTPPHDAGFHAAANGERSAMQRYARTLSRLRHGG